MSKKEKLKRLILLAVWCIVAIAIYIGAISGGFLVVTLVYPLIVVLCAIVYAVCYFRIITLRSKAGVAPNEKFEFDTCDKLTVKEKDFLRKADKAVKMVVFIAIPLLFIMMVDFIYTGFGMGGVL